jgi:hypothetical protein
LTLTASVPPCDQKIKQHVPHASTSPLFIDEVVIAIRFGSGRFKRSSSRFRSCSPPPSEHNSTRTTYQPPRRDVNTASMSAYSDSFLRQPTLRLVHDSSNITCYTCDHNSLEYSSSRAVLKPLLLMEGFLALLRSFTWFYARKRPWSKCRLHEHRAWT